MRQLEAQLRHADASSLAARSKRAASLALLGTPEAGWMLWGHAHVALTEAEESYVNGQFMCTVLAAQACLEKLLGGLLDFAEIRPQNGSFAVLLRQAHNARLLTQWEFETFDDLRRSRNPHAHFRGINHPEHPVRRAMNTDVHPEELLHEEAWAAVSALRAFLSRPPFAMGPLVRPFDEDDLLPVVHPEQLLLMP